MRYGASALPSPPPNGLAVSSQAMGSRQAPARASSTQLGPPPPTPGAPPPVPVWPPEASSPPAPSAVSPPPPDVVPPPPPVPSASTPSPPLQAASARGRLTVRAPRAILVLTVNA